MNAKHPLRYRYLDPEATIGSADFRVVESFLRATGRTEIGWHYIVDLTWIYSLAKDWPRSLRVLDAGGGGGPTQFLLAEMGFQVTNIDMILDAPPPAVRRRYSTHLTRLPSFEPTDYLQHMAEFSQPLRKRLRWALARTPLWAEISAHRYRWRHEAWRRRHTTGPLGTLEWVQGNLCCIPEIGDASFDALVSLSALEHIPIHTLPSALRELGRVLAPAGRVAITTSATEAADSWFHEASRGHCFAAADLTSVFGADQATALTAPQAIEKYRGSKYLRENLASFYRVSGRNGMPWGRWDPRYVPVAIWR